MTLPISNKHTKKLLPILSLILYSSFSSSLYYYLLLALFYNWHIFINLYRLKYLFSPHFRSVCCRCPNFFQIFKIILIFAIYI